MNESSFVVEKQLPVHCNFFFDGKEFSFMHAYQTDWAILLLLKLYKLFKNITLNKRIQSSLVDLFSCTNICQQLFRDFYIQSRHFQE